MGICTKKNATCKFNILILLIIILYIFWLIFFLFLWRKAIIVCEASIFNVSCPIGKQPTIFSVLFGRSDLTSCCRNALHCNNTKCAYNAPLNAIKLSYNQQFYQSQSLDAALYGFDPCSGFYKYSNISYMCE